MYGLARPFFFAFDAETAHGLGLRAMEAAYRSGTHGLLGGRPPSLATAAFGLQFDNPVGLAAGMDKNGGYVDALFALGFGFVEVGTVTPRPQPGNPKPRMFRLPEHQAVINRLGFNNDGVDALLRNLDRARRPGMVGVNIGKNKDTPNERAAEDYLFCLERVHGVADYVTVNISSPNTAGLRDLQQEESLYALLSTLREARDRLGAQGARRVPLLVKLAPDLDEAGIDGSAASIARAGIDGVIATNTTLDRTLVAGDRHAAEAGGLSGRPLMTRSTAVLRALRERLPAAIGMIGVGGILDGTDAAAKTEAGALLVQCYTGLVYRGPDLVRESVEAIRRQRGERAPA
ncbi:quinone-dependent dihydroorotate dehydrogenase [Coralloluteibacterium stylophorae]|uniref:Dihydroorotate dehydrogenase (quinone) n=1 Tax=Coralloluteibacterium stylophorae TaxID=1776034 RepID=A0A8J8AXT8_9GAMM|nr:quinone-dependent dihydroorotate dehydrogenase [Coralloluteibacterium stylophorae]MBS7455638.1 quinone-dependent dihydroorotate dehydrogenase [Coralloluteibacterium stylophorae]